MFGLTPTELIVVGTIVVLLFVSRLPSVVRSLGAEHRGIHDGAMGDNRHRASWDLDENRTQALWLAPMLALVGGLFGVIVERVIMGRWGYSGLWLGAFLAIAMLITGLVSRR